MKSQLETEDIEAIGPGHRHLLRDGELRPRLGHDGEEESGKEGAGRTSKSMLKRGHSGGHSVYIPLQDKGQITSIGPTIQ